MSTIKFGLIGCGRISKNHLESIEQIAEAELIAVADIDESILKNATEKYKCSAYLDYQELLKDKNIDVVNICTPSGSHAQIAIDAMNAGKHVLVEKPMAMSLVEANAMIDTAKKNNVKLGVVHQNRFNKPILKVRKALEEGKFGKLTHGSAVIRWNRNDDYYKQAPWRGTWANDGGCLMNQSIHNIDLLQWMFGDVESVFAYTATNMRPIEAEDTAVAILKFKNGAIATVEAATTIYPTNLEETLNIFGTTGTVIVGGVAVNKLETWRFEGEDETKIIAEQFAEPPNVYGFGHADIILDMITAIKENKEPFIDGIEGKKAVEIILAIYHSVRLKTEVRILLQ